MAEPELWMPRYKGERPPDPLPAPGTWKGKSGLPGLLLGTEEDFQEELRRRGLHKEYQDVLDAWGGDTSLGDEPLWLKKKYQEIAAYEEVVPDLPPEVTAAGYAAMNNLSPDDMEGRLALLRKAAEKIEREDGFFDEALTHGAKAHLSGEPYDLDRMREILGEDVTGAEKPGSLRGFNFGHTQATKHFTGEIPVRARQMIWILRTAMGESVENMAGWRLGGKPIPEDVTSEKDEDAPEGTYDQKVVLAEIANWFVNATEDDRNKWGAAVKLLVTLEGDVEPGFWKRAGQILDQPLAKAASAIGQAGIGAQAIMAKGVEFATGDLIKKLPYWADSESLERGADWWSMRSRMWNFLDRDVAPWVDMEGAGDIKKGLYAGYESWTFFAMAALGGPFGLSMGGLMEAGMVDQELREQFGDDIPDDVRMSIALGTGAINAALERWAWRGTVGLGRWAAKGKAGAKGNWISPIYQAMRRKSMRNLLTRAGVKGFAARSARVLGAMGGSVGIEWAEETIQDLTKATLSELAELVVPDLMPEHSWAEAVREWGNHHGVRLWAVLPYAILGVGGGAIKQRSSNRFLKSYLTDREGLRESGVFADTESLEAFAEEARKDPVVAADEFQRLHQAGDGNTRTLNRDNLTNEEARRQSDENDQIVVNQQAAGGYQVIIPGQEAYKADTLAEANEIALAHEMLKEAGRLEELPELIKAHQEAIKAQAEPEGFQDPKVMGEQAESERARDRGIEPTLDLQKEVSGLASDLRLESLKQEKGISLPPGSEVRILGGTRLYQDKKTDKWRAAIRVLKGGSALTFIEEQAEGWLGLELKNGRLVEEDVRKRFDEVSERLGMDLNTEGLEGILEAFSTLTSAYAAGSLTTEDMDTLGAKLANWIRQFSEYLRKLLRFANVMREAREQGELDTVLEGWMREALGLDQAQAMEESVKEQTKKLEEENAALDEPYNGLSLSDLLFSARWAQERDEEFMASIDAVWAQSEEEAALIREKEGEEEMLAGEEQRAREAQYGPEEVSPEEAQRQFNYVRWEKKQESLYYKRLEFDKRLELKETPFYEAVLNPRGMKVLSESQAKKRGLWHKGMGEWDAGRGLGPARVKGAALPPGAKKGKKTKVAVAGGEIPQFYMKMLWPKEGAPAEMPSTVAQSLASDPLTSHLVTEGSADQFWEAFRNTVNDDIAYRKARDRLKEEEEALEKEGIELELEQRRGDLVTFSVARATPGVDTRMIVTKDKTVLGPATFSIAGHHGTQRKVSPRFTLEKIGTGTGSQIWGFGLYFGGHKDIGESYARRLSQQHGPFKIAHAGALGLTVKVKRGFAVTPETAAIRKYFVLDSRTGERVLPARGEPTLLTGEEAGKLKQKLNYDAMNRYEVSLDVEVEEMIYANTKFKDQSKFVQETLKKIVPAWDRQVVVGETVIKVGKTQAATWSDSEAVYPFGDAQVRALLKLSVVPGTMDLVDPSGKAIDLSQWQHGKGDVSKMVSMKLLEHGIKGIIYEETSTGPTYSRYSLREQAKAAGRSYIPWRTDPSSQSFVVFDAKDIKIVSENGKPVALEQHPESYSVAPKFTPPPGPVARNNVEIKKKGKPTKVGPLPTWTARSIKGSLGKEILAVAHKKEGIPGKALFDRLDLAREMVADDPGRLASGAGWVETMRAAGVWGDIMVPPGLMKVIVERPEQYVGLLSGAYHGERTAPGVYDAARTGLNWTKKMGRELSKTGAVPEWNTVLHHFWGLLSRRATPVQQEAMWLRMLTHRPLLDAIQHSIDGNFRTWVQQEFKSKRKELIKKTRKMRTNDYGQVAPIKARDVWRALVIDARAATWDAATPPGGTPMGNNVTSNTNDFYAMLNAWDGMWGQVSNIYWTNDSIEMGRRFHSLGTGNVGIGNKVQRFVGLTYGIPGLIMDRWKYVEFWLPDLMKLARVRKPGNFFTYNKAGRPEDPSGLYGFYSRLESTNDAFSLALYELMETGLEQAIDNSPELKKFLGPNANVGGLHWHGWNAIKNEAVGHSSLDLSLDLLRNYGLKSDAAAVEATIQAGTYHTQTEKADGTVERFTISGGTPSATRERVPDGPRDRALGRRVDATSPGRGRREGQETYAIAPGYRAAVESGDMESAQRMVDAAADASSYVVEAWHQGKETFDAFKRSAKTDLSPMGFHFGTKEQAEFRATQYDYIPGDTPSLRKFRLKIQNPYRVNHRASHSPDWLAEALIDDGMVGEEINDWLDKNTFEPVKQGDRLVRILQENGYDGLVYSNEMEGAGDSYVAFDASDIKSADPATYDKKGNLIPLSERFDITTDKLSYSIAAPALDEAHRETYQEPKDEAKGKELARKAAAKAGFKTKVYHATLADFEAFDTRMGKEEVQGIHVGTKAQAVSVVERLERIAGLAGDVLDAVLGPELPTVSAKVARTMELFIKAENPLRVDDQTDWDAQGLQDALNLRLEGADPWGELEPFDIKRGYDPDEEGPIVFNYEKAPDKRPGHEEWSGSSRDVVRADEIYDVLQRYGYDSLVYKNRYEGKVEHPRRKRPGEDSYVLFKPEQLKSAEAWTFDDQGELIPLSERFDITTDKLSYSIAPQDSVVYHTTYTKNVRSIKEEGLDSDSYERIWGTHQDISGNYAFTNLIDAVKWGATMGWEQFQDYGSPQVSIIRIRAPGGMEQDPTEDILGLAGATGDWVRAPEMIPAESVIDSVRMNDDIIKAWQAKKLDDSIFPTKLSFAIAPGEAFDPLMEAIRDRINDSTEGVVPFLEKMRERVAEIKAGFEARDDGSGDLDLRTALTYLGAIQRVLPREIQHFAGSARRLVDLKTIESMELELSRRIPRISAAIETYLARSHRKSIRKILKAGAAKVGNSRKASGKIGPAGHAIFKEAKVAMGLQLTEDEKKADRTLQEKGEEMAQGILDQIEDNDSLTLDEVDELDGRAAAWLLFTDYQEADSQRLREGLDLLKDVYHEGREKWLRVLGARKAERESRLQVMERMLKDTSRAGRAESMRVDEGALRRLSEGFMAAFLSGSQTIRRLAELSSDPVISALVEEMEEALAFAENEETDLDYQDNEAFSEALYRILGVKYEHQLSRKIKKYATAPDKNVPVSSLEGRKTRVYSVSRMEAERIANGEATGFISKKEWVELNLAIRNAIEKAWAEFEELSEEEQKGRRVLKFEVVEATGNRKSLGRRTNFELLNLWLTMRQPDQAEKLHRLGYDEITQRELQGHLPYEVIALGLWMADYLRQDTAVVNRIHRAEKGVNLNLVENYWPVRNDVSGQTYDDLNLDGNRIQEGRSVSFTMQRVTNNAEPAIADALGVFLAHRSQVNFWKSHVAALREWGGLVKHERFSNTIRRTMGDLYYQSLSQRMERVGNGGVMRAGRALAFDRLIKNLKRRTSLGILGGRLSTIMVNFTAAANAFLEIPVNELIKGLLLASKRPGAWKEAWNSPAIRRRLRDGSSYEAQIAKARGPSKRPIISQLEKAAEYGLSPINYADTGSNMLGAVAVYEYTRVNALKAGATEVEAKLEGDLAVDRLLRRAAQPTARHQRSEMEMRALENPLAALFALFVSEPRKNLSILVLAARQLTTGKGVYETKAMAAQAFTSSAILLLALEHILRLAYQAVFRADEDDEEEVIARFLDKLTDAKAWAYRLGAGHAAGIPIVGPVYEWLIAYLVNASSLPGEDVFQFTSTDNPAMRAVGKAAIGAKNIIEPKDDASKMESFDATIDLVQAGGQLVPGGPLFSQLANLGEAALGFNSANISQEDRRGRVKGRFNKYKKGLDKRLGPTTNKKTGDIDRDIQEAKWDAQAAYLLEALAPLALEDIIKITQELTIPTYVREEIEFGLLNGLDTTTIEDE